ncbi:MAG: prepilin-type N-terminal cleavage/methylation domain-containing protein [Silvanigrellaceae bacterium]|nr:prepilin-type N-terminal cleavage/methylation domain-containing protein [Silvanigrellaceae bacterium]
MMLSFLKKSNKLLIWNDLFNLKIFKIKRSTEPSCSLDGFTLLESLLAIALLSIVIANIVGLQSSSLSATSSGLDNIKTSWILRSALSQIQYVADIQGPKEIPESQSYAWTPENKFVVTISRKELSDLKPSNLLISAITIFNKANGGDDENLDTNAVFGPLGNSLDNSVQENLFHHISILVNWTVGTKAKKAEDGIILIDRSGISQIQSIGI